MMFIIIQKMSSGNYVRVLCNSLVTGSETGKVYFSLYLLHFGKTLLFFFICCILTIILIMIIIWKLISLGSAVSCVCVCLNINFQFNLCRESSK